MWILPFSLKPHFLMFFPYVSKGILKITHISLISYFLAYAIQVFFSFL